jgi:hypothetical protein
MDLGLDGRVYLVTGGSRAAAEPAAGAVPADPAPPGRLIAAARDRFGRLHGTLISVGGSLSGTVATTTDEAWRSAFEIVFLGAIRLARILAADLGGTGDGSAAAGSVTGAGRLDRLRAGLLGAGAARGTGHLQRLFPAWPGWSRRSPRNSARPGSGSTRCCRSGSPPTGSGNLMPCAETRTRYAPACALPRRVLHHRRDDPRRRRCHQLGLSTQPPARLPRSGFVCNPAAGTTDRSAKEFQVSERAVVLRPPSDGRKRRARAMAPSAARSRTRSRWRGRSAGWLRR